MIIKDNIKNIIAADINGRCVALSDLNPIAVSKKIEDGFFKKYKIDISGMLGGRVYKINTRGELKFAIDDAKDSTSDLNDMKTYLKDNYRIEMKSDGKDFMFKHPEDESFVRGSVLGKEYEAKNISRYFLDKSKGGNPTKGDFDKVKNITNRTLKGKDKEKRKSKGLSMER